MSKEDFEKAMAELDIAAVKNRKYEKMADTIRAHVAELETMVEGHKLAADAAMGLAGDLKAKLAEVEQESIRRGDLIADKAFKLVDVRKERDALRKDRDFWRAEAFKQQEKRAEMAIQYISAATGADSKEGEKGE